MDLQRAAVIVGSIDEALHCIGAGSTDIVFAVTLWPRSPELARERTASAQLAPVRSWCETVSGRGVRAHVQIRDLALGPDLLGQTIAFVAGLGSHVCECWTGDLSLVAALSHELPGTPVRADWRIPLTNSRGCELALSTGASGICIAPPAFDLPAHVDTAFLAVQGTPCFDPRLDATCELFTAPFVLGELEWQSFTYPIPPADVDSARNRTLRQLEGAWRQSVCPLSSLERILDHWRNWGCAACQTQSWLPVVELPPTPEAAVHALAAVRGLSPRTVAGTLPRPDLCQTGARCR